MALAGHQSELGRRGGGAKAIGSWVAWCTLPVGYIGIWEWQVGVYGYLGVAGAGTIGRSEIRCEPIYIPFGGQILAFASRRFVLGQ